MNRPALRSLVAGFALTAAMVGVPATAHAQNYYCDWDSGYGCESYGYANYPTDHGRDYGHGYDGYDHHGRHHRY